MSAAGGRARRMISLARANVLAALAYGLCEMPSYNWFRTDSTHSIKRMML